MNSGLFEIAGEADDTPQPELKPQEFTYVEYGMNVESKSVCCGDDDAVFWSTRLVQLSRARDIH